MVEIKYSVWTKPDINFTEHSFTSGCCVGIYLTRESATSAVQRICENFDNFTVEQFVIIPIEVESLINE